LGVFNEENLFACGRDFRLGSFATDAFRASLRMAQEQGFCLLKTEIVTG
jgi:hypothetical protein